MLLPPAAGNYTDLYAAQGKVVYRRLPLAGSADEKSPIVYYDLKEREEKTVLAEADGFELSADGKKLLVAKGRQYAIVDLKADAKFEHPLRTAEMVTVVDPRAEWRQIFADVWRALSRLLLRPLDARRGLDADADAVRPADRRCGHPVGRQLRHRRADQRAELVAHLSRRRR